MHISECNAAVSYDVLFPSVLRRYWLGIRKGIQPVKSRALVVHGDFLERSL